MALSQRPHCGAWFWRRRALVVVAVLCVLAGSGGCVLFWVWAGLCVVTVGSSFAPCAVAGRPAILVGMRAAVVAA